MHKKALPITILAALFLLAAAGAAGAAEPEVPDAVVLSVTGTGRVAVAPDTADVTVGVTTTGKTAREAQQENSRVAAAVINAVTKLGIPRERIQTVEFSVWPIYEEPVKGSAPPIRGYRVNNNIRVTVDDPAKVGAVLDAAFAAGANQSYGIHFYKKNDAAERTRALQEAVRDARARAEAVAQALGARIAGFAAVRVENIFSPVPAYKMYEGAGGDGGVPVVPGQVEITASVFIDYKLAL
ncbi:MAG: SIMPL domain-containing protein [Bacillota bacterium]